MDIFSIFTLCGGLAFFLYGMMIMSAGLEKIAYSIRQKKAELSLDDDISGLFFRALAVTSFDWAEDDLLELKAEVDKYVLIC